MTIRVIAAIDVRCLDASVHRIGRDGTGGGRDDHIHKRDRAVCGGWTLGVSAYRTGIQSSNSSLKTEILST